MVPYWYGESVVVFSGQLRRLRLGEVGTDCYKLNVILTLSCMQQEGALFWLTVVGEVSYLVKVLSVLS